MYFNALIAQYNRKIDLSSNRKIKQAWKQIIKPQKCLVKVKSQQTEKSCTLNNDIHSRLKN